MCSCSNLRPERDHPLCGNELFVSFGLWEGIPYYSTNSYHRFSREKDRSRVGECLHRTHFTWTWTPCSLLSINMIGVSMPSMKGNNQIKTSSSSSAFKCIPVVILLQILDKIEKSERWGRACLVPRIRAMVAGDVLILLTVIWTIEMRENVRESNAKWQTGVDMRWISCRF